MAKVSVEDDVLNTRKHVSMHTHTHTCAPMHTQTHSCCVEERPVVLEPVREAMNRRFPTERHQEDKNSRRVLLKHPSPTSPGALGPPRGCTSVSGASQVTFYSFSRRFHPQRLTKKRAYEKNSVKLTRWLESGEHSGFYQAQKRITTYSFQGRFLLWSSRYMRY